METFAKLFGSLLALVYHCFDRIVILGHLPLLTRPENIVHFFRDIHQVKTISKEVLRQRTDDYHRWVEAFAKKRKIPMEWAEKGVRKEDYVRPYLRRMERRNQFGVYFILKSMELGPSFRSAVPRFPVDDPHYRILVRQRSRYTHYYFYIRDEVLGPIALCVGSFLPFSITYYLNGHNFIELELERAGVKFRKDDNAFLWVADANALQAAADRLSPQIIHKLDRWTWVVGPKFSQKDREAINLSRHYSLQQVEYCRNFVFRRNFPIHKLYERSCDLGLFRLTADKLSQMFGFRLHKRIAGKLTTVLERMDHGHHVLRACGKNAVLRMYEKFATFLRLEVLSNNLKDFGLKKSLHNLETVRQPLATATDRFAEFEAQALDVHVEFPLFQRLALPISRGKHQNPWGIKIQDTRMLRLMEVLLHRGTQLGGWRSRQIHEAMLSSFQLNIANYTLTQLRYDLRKLKAHGLIQRDGQHYAYRLTDKGIRVALTFVLFHQRICGPLANRLFHRQPTQLHTPTSKLQAAYQKADASIQEAIDLLAA
jgi:hypothetical protein